MATKPDKKPEWARVAEVDPVSGQNNYVEPSESKKDSGYTRAEIPPRQWINWLLKKAGEWIGYFEEVTDQLLEDVSGLQGQIVVLGYRLGDAVYSGSLFDVSAQDSVPFSVRFNTDGTKMFVLGFDTDTIYQYSLSTGFDLSTASYDSVSFDVSGEDTLPRGVSFNLDGTKMFVLGGDADTIYQYSLSTGFDLSTASYDSVSFDVSSQAGDARGFCFSADGTKMFVADNINDSVYQYSLSTAFDLSTASYDSVSFDVSAQDATPRAVNFNQDGTKMFLLGQSTDDFYQYSLSTGFDLSTASYDSVSLDISTEESAPTGFTFSPDGTKMFVSGSGGDSVYKYYTSRVVGA